MSSALFSSFLLSVSFLCITLFYYLLLLLLFIIFLNTSFVQNKKCAFIFLVEIKATKAEVEIFEIVLNHPTLILLTNFDAIIQR